MIENLILDTKIMFLCALKPKIEHFLHFWGGHFEIQDGRHFLNIFFASHNIHQTILYDFRNQLHAQGSVTSCSIWLI